MTSLADPGVLESLITRLGKLHPERPRAWGRMTPNEMMCHLADSFELALGERPFVPADTWMRRNVLKYVALRTSYEWPQGLETLPEVAQGGGGTRPVDFERDRARLVAFMRRFAAADTKYGRSHPAFGPMTREEWLIWGFRHTDHHLRQFAL
jgi:hypothetical protein